MDAIEFEASLPPIQGAIRLDGAGGARVQLDVPESDKAEVLKLSCLTERTFKVRIYEWEED